MPAKIVIAGSSGFVGRHLVTALRDRGHRVSRLVRDRSEAATDPQAIPWDPAAGTLDPTAVDGVDVVVNLCGRNIGGSRWTTQVKRDLVRSRIDPTRTLGAAIRAASAPPRLLLNSSATGVYGDRGEQQVDESSPPTEGFLATLARDWEAAAGEARSASTRVTLLRLGMVVGRGGALQKMLPMFRLGLGGPIGSGAQWWPWIGIRDVVGAVVHLIEGAGFDGPVNLVSPQQIRCRDFTATLGRCLHRPAVLPAPAFALRLLFGEMAESLLLASTRVQPGILDHRLKYEFEHPELHSALAHALD